MAFRFLYYPYFSVPAEAWLRRVLLYSDTIATIVPARMSVRQNLDRHMQVLLEHGEVKLLDPQRFLLSQEDPEDFHYDFLRQITSPHFQHWYETHRTGRLSRLHLDKMTAMTMHWMHECDYLGVRQEGSWLIVDECIAFLYVGLLALHMANSDPSAYTPCTDRSEYEKLVFAGYGPGPTHPVLSVLLRQVLPVPGPSASITDIVHFKRTHWEELIAHRQLLREIQHRLGVTTDAVEMKEIADEYAERIESGVHRVSKLMEASRLDRAMTSIKSLLDVKTEGKLSFAASLIRVGVTLISASRKPIAPREDMAFSYVFHANEHFGNCQPWRGWSERGPVPW